MFTLTTKPKPEKGPIKDSDLLLFFIAKVGPRYRFASKEQHFIKGLERCNNSLVQWINVRTTPFFLFTKTPQSSAPCATGPITWSKNQLNPRNRLKPSIWSYLEPPLCGEPNLSSTEPKFTAGGPWRAQASTPPKTDRNLSQRKTEPYEPLPRQLPAPDLEQTGATSTLLPSRRSPPTRFSDASPEHSCQAKHDTHGPPVWRTI